MRVYYGDPAKLAAPRPALSSQLLELVGERYGLCVDSPRDLGGSFNLNVLVDGHVLRVYGPWVSAERLQELQRIRRVLRSRGAPIPGLRPAADGSPWGAWGDCVFEVESYMAGAPMDSWERLSTGMRALGRLHSLMADLDVRVPPPIANHLPQEIALAATLDATAIIRSWGPTAQEERYAECAETLARMLPVTPLPCQLVHGDFWDNNVLFHDSELDRIQDGTRTVLGRRGAAGVCSSHPGFGLAAVLDLDFAGVRPRIDDLALPLGYCVLDAGARPADVRGLVDAYDAGCTTPLSDGERRALPFAMARMALSFLQYLVLPGDAAYLAGRRQELNEKRGPACAWWLDALRDGALEEGTFA